MSDKYDLYPSESDLNWENYTKHSGNDGCKKCTVVGAHHWITVCACCGTQQSRFDTGHIEIRQVNNGIEIENVQMEGEC